MDDQTALVLALQVVALFSIAGALLLYLVCKIKAGTGNEGPDESLPGAGKPVLVTSCDNAIGLQIAIHLANRGFRVFAGLRAGASTAGYPHHNSSEISSNPSADSVSARVIRSWQKHREATPGIVQGALVALPLDVTREDLLHESVDIIRAHLPAGEDGMWAVLNTSGLSFRGRIDQQDIGHWDAILKTNVVAVLRTARTFQGLLRHAQGRILTLGAAGDAAGDAPGLVAYTAARYAVEGASKALRQEFAPLGIKVITMNPQGLSTDFMFTTPRLMKKEQGSEVSVDISGCLAYQPTILTPAALRILDIAITTSKPKENYLLLKKTPWHRPLEYFNIA